MDPHIRTKIYAELSKIELELNSPEMTDTLAEVLYDERDTLLRMLQEDSTEWNHLEFVEPEADWPPPVDEGAPCVVCACETGYEFMNGRCADCYWENREPEEEDQGDCSRCAGCAYCAGDGGGYDQADEV